MSILLSSPLCACACSFAINQLGDNCIQIFHLGRYIVGYTVGNFVLRRRVSGAVKHDFRPYIRRYTTPNEKFEYCYPHSNVLFNYKHRKNTLFFAKRERHQRRKTRRLPITSDVAHDVGFPTVLTLSNQTSRYILKCIRMSVQLHYKKSILKRLLRKYNVRIDVT